MAILQGLQRIPLEIYRSVKVHFIEGFHRYLALSAVLCSIFLVVELYVVLDWTPWIARLLIFAWRNGG